MNVAQLIARCLENEGVKYIFGLPGEEIIHLLDALNDSPLRFILARSEQGAAFMAEMYGRVTGKAGVCLATLGPGAINLLLGVADAQTDSTPLVALSAQVGLGRIYKETHQVVDLVGLFKPVTKWADTLLTPGATPEMIRQAFHIAQTERPGAVYLAIPQDVEALAVEPTLRPLPVHPVRASAPDPAQIVRAAKLLESARTPIILAGHGAARHRAQEALIQFSEKLQIPVATTFHGKGVFPDDHPNALGAMGFMVHDYVNFGFDQADVIVSVGYELQEFPPARLNPAGDQKIIHLHGFPAVVDAYYNVAVEVLGDIPAALTALAARVSPQPGLVATERQIRCLLRQELERGRQDESYPVKPQRLVADIRAALGRDDVVLVDSGAVKMWMARLYPTYRPNTCLVSNGLSTMGFALPGALGGQAGLSRPPGAGGHGRRRLFDELPGNRNRPAGENSLRHPGLGGRQLRPDQVEDGHAAAPRLAGGLRQPRLCEVRRKLRSPRPFYSGGRRPAADAHAGPGPGHGLGHRLPGGLLGEHQTHREAGASEPTG